MNNIVKELARIAKKDGICEEWYERLKDTKSTEELIDMYIEGIDFCLSNNFPGNEYIRKHFVGKIEHRGIYLDGNIQLSNSRYLVALGNTRGQIEVDGYEVSEVFAKDDSELVVNARGNAFVVVDMFDNSDVTVLCSDTARVQVNRYGGRITTKTSDGAFIRITKKNKKTY